MSMGHWWKVVN